MSNASLNKVYLRNLVGEYLSRDGRNWTFTLDQTKAHVFDYEADNVAEQLELAKRDSGVIWVAVQIDQNAEAETCDACGRKTRFTDILFDDTRYLCPNCRKSKAAPATKADS